MSKKAWCLIGLVGLVLSAQVGCGAVGQTPSATAAPAAQVTVAPTVEAAAAYPGPGSALPGSALPGSAGPTIVPTKEGYPGPQADVATPMPTRTPVDTQGTPGDGLANVQGAALMLKGGTSETMPLENMVLYLAIMLNNDKGEPSGIVRVNESNAPMAMTDLEGDFVFVNVEPGWYGLTIKHPLSLLMATNADTGEDIVFELKAGDTLDLGTFTVRLSGT